MTELDDTGVYELLGGVVRRAQQDAKRGKPEVAADAAEFLTDLAGDAADQMPDWYHDMKRRVDALDALLQNGTAPAPKAKPEPAPLTADEIAENARRLTDLGISPEWAAIQADPVKMAEQQRRQAHRDRAARLGVDPRYLPEDFGNE